MTSTGSLDGPSATRVYTAADVSDGKASLERLVDETAGSLEDDAVAAALFWVFEHKTSLGVETARLRFRKHRGPMLSMPDESYRIGLHLRSSDRCSCDDLKRIADDVGTEQEFILVTASGLTRDARQWIETIPWMHYISLRRTLQFDEVPA